MRLQLFFCHNLSEMIWTQPVSNSYWCFWDPPPPPRRGELHPKPEISAGFCFIKSTNLCRKMTWNVPELSDSFSVSAVICISSLIIVRDKFKSLFSPASELHVGSVTSSLRLSQPHSDAGERLFSVGHWCASSCSRWTRLWLSKSADSASEEGRAGFKSLLGIQGQIIITAWVQQGMLGGGRAGCSGEL